jgi:hypothetical protein
MNLFFIFALTALIIASTSNSNANAQLIDLSEGIAVSHTTECNEYSYFRFNVNLDCVDFVIDVDSSAGQPDLYISRTETEPTMESLTWTSYEWGAEHLTIHNYDPEFQKGYYYIGVFAYCGDDVESGQDAATYLITVHLVPTTLPLATNTSDILNIPFNSVDIINGNYHYYMFCVPDACADIDIDLTFSLTGGGSFTGNAFVSTNIPFATNSDYSWKLNTATTLTISGDHPLYRAGAYFISILGSCDTCTGITYDLQVTNPVKGSCNPVGTSPPTPTTLTLGQSLSAQTVTCGTYNYYSINFNKLCEDLKITVTPTNAGKTNTFVSSKINIMPISSEIGWSVTGATAMYSTIIQEFDLNFQAGVYYIGIYGDCLGGGTNPTFNIVAESSNAYNLYETGEIEDTVTANGYNRYQFCVPENGLDVTVNLVGILNNKKHPTTYTWPEMLVTRKVKYADIYSYSWKLAQIERRYVFLAKDDVNAGAGRYFVTIFGWCTPAEYCPDPKSCGPCENYDNENSPYTLEVYNGKPPKNSGFSKLPSTFIFSIIVSLSSFILMFAF